MCAQLGHCNSVKESNEKRNNPNFAVKLGAYFKKKHSKLFDQNIFYFDFYNFEPSIRQTMNSICNSVLKVDPIVDPILHLIH